MAGFFNLKDRATSISNDLVYDLLKILILVGGGGMITWLAAHSAYVTGRPLYQSLTIGVVLFLLLALILYLISLAVAHFRKPKPISDREAWLNAIAANDKTEINKAIRVLAGHVGWSDDILSPFANFAFDVLNLSVYPISISRVEGFVTYDDSKLTGEITISVKIVNLQPRAMASFEIRQELAKAEGVLIRKHSDDQYRYAWFGFEHLLIYAQGGDGFEDVGAKPLRFPFSGIGLDQKWL